MENGATVKGLNGYLKREPSAVWYSVYGQKGMMESDRWQEGVKRVNIFQEGDSLTPTQVSYQPKPVVDTRLARMTTGHSGGHFYTMHYFLEKILGNPGGEECIDVYETLDMSMPGILGYRSILNGNVPIQIPDLRDKAQRDAWRNDNACTNLDVAAISLFRAARSTRRTSPTRVRGRSQTVAQGRGRTLEQFFNFHDQSIGFFEAARSNRSVERAASQ